MHKCYMYIIVYKYVYHLDLHLPLIKLIKVILKNPNTEKNFATWNHVGLLKRVSRIYFSKLSLIQNRLDVAAADPTTPSSGSDHQSKGVNQGVREQERPLLRF